MLDLPATSRCVIVHVGACFGQQISSSEPLEGVGEVNIASYTGLIGHCFKLYRSNREWQAGTLVSPPAVLEYETQSPIHTRQNRCGRIGCFVLQRLYWRSEMTLDRIGYCFFFVRYWISISDRDIYYIYSILPSTHAKLQQERNAALNYANEAAPTALRRATSNFTGSTQRRTAPFKTHLWILTRLDHWIFFTAVSTRDIACALINFGPDNANKAAF